MASGIAGSKGSTSSRPKGKPDPAEGVRRVRVIQLLATQAMLAALFVLMAFLSHHEPVHLALWLWTLLVPAGFSFAYGSAYLRHERARREGTWTKEWSRKEDARGYGILGIVFTLWIAGVLAILVLL